MKGWAFWIIDTLRLDPYLMFIVYHEYFTVKHRAFKNLIKCLSRSRGAFL